MSVDKCGGILTNTYDYSHESLDSFLGTIRVFDLLLC